MRTVTSRHWLCGTEVHEEVADDYDLSDGLALVCPTCKDVWWHYPDSVEEEPAEEGAGGSPPETPVPAPPAAAAAPPPLANPPSPSPSPPPPSPPRSPPSRRSALRPATERRPLDMSDEELTRRSWPGERPGLTPAPGPAEDGSRLAHGWIVPALALAVLALVVLQLVNIGDRASSPPPPRVDSPDGRPAPLVPAPPAAAPVVTVRGEGFTIQRPRSWEAFDSAGATVVAPARTAPIGVYVYASRRRDLGLARMAASAANTMRAAAPGARITRPAPVRVAGLDGLRVTSSLGGARRAITVVAAGANRFAIDVRASRSASAEQQRQAAAVAASFRPR